MRVSRLGFFCLLLLFFFVFFFYIIQNLGVSAFPKYSVPGFSGAFPHHNNGSFLVFCVKMRGGVGVGVSECVRAWCGAFVLAFQLHKSRRIQLSWEPQTVLLLDIGYFALGLGYFDTLIS